MALFDIIKRKKIKGEKIKEKKPERIKPKKRVRKPEPAKEPEKKETEKKVALLKKERKAIAGEAYLILKSPHVTEKATDLVKKNQYVFKVFPKVNKIMVEKAIEDLYGVDVVSVKIVNVPSKKRRLGKVSGLRKGYKKAIIKIKEGQKIEIMPR